MTTETTRLRNALDAIAQAFDCPRDRLGRLMNMQGQAEALRKLAVAYNVGGASDTMDQARLVALAVLSERSYDECE